MSSSEPGRGILPGDCAAAAGAGWIVAAAGCAGGAAALPIAMSKKARWAASRAGSPRPAAGVGAVEGRIGGRTGEVTAGS